MTKTRTALAALAAGLALTGGLACGIGVNSTPTDPADHTTGATRTPTAAPTTKPTKPPTTRPTAPTDPATSAIAVSAEQTNAVGTAKDYLDGQSFSRKGLIAQLKYEGYSAKIATAAVDSLHIDWNAQAVGVAKDYLDSQHFSRTGLIGQLEFDGFTHAQAVHGVGGAGL